MSGSVTKLGPAPIRSTKDERAEVVLKAVRLMLENLSGEERARVIAEIASDANPSPKAGAVLGTIIRLLPKKDAWSVEEVKAAVRDSGVEASDKEVYNAVGYLTRRGQLRRVGYGRYVVDGVEVVTTDDLGGPNARHEDEYHSTRIEGDPDKK